MGIPAQTDILVIGGGPAGTCAATELARRGYGVVLVDKARHPREVVGESILPHAWRYFDRLGATKRVEHEGFVKKAGGVIAWEDQVTEISFRDFDFDRPGLHVERAALDHLLLSNARDAGVQVFEGVMAESFVEDQGQGARVWLLDMESKERRLVTCRFLVDASGQASFVARQLGVKRLDPDFRFIALWGYFAGSRYVGSGGIVRPFEDIAKHPPMTFVCSRGNWGWAWHIPLRKDTSVGILVPFEEYKNAADAARSRERYFLDACMSTPHLAELIEGAQLSEGGVRLMRDFSYSSGKIAGPGYFVIGDAAGFVDPIFSIGVVVALYAGELAAWAIDSSLRRPANAAAYRTLFETQLAGRVQLYRTVALPCRDDATPAPDAAKVYFDFIPKAEQQLMWSAASMTSRSGNLVRTGGANWMPPPLKRYDLKALRFQ
jgi:flavin-dependent dehydrogenase